MRAGCALRVLLAVMAVVSGAACRSDSIAGAQARPSGPCDPGLPVTSPDQLRVVRACLGDKTVYVSTLAADSATHIYVLVTGLDRYITWYNAQKSANPLQDPKKFILFVDGRPIDGLYPFLPEAGYSHLRYELNHADSAAGASRQTWTTLWSNALRGRKVPLTIGFEGQRPLSSDINDFYLRGIQTSWLVLWIAISGGVFGLLWWAASKGNVLRVTGPEPPAPAGGVAPRKAYSLARFQMAAWFFVVFAAYLLIYLITDALDTITPTVLGLMGISAATGFAATVFDTGTPGSVVQPAPPTAGFFTDLASDESGVSLPRLQILLWTGVLIFIFGKVVYETLAMPDFNATLLGLMGISGGTYVGFKLPDKKS